MKKKKKEQCSMYDRTISIIDSRYFFIAIFYGAQYKREKKRRDLNKLVSISKELSCYLLCKLFLLFFFYFIDRHHSVLEHENENSS
jgi:hypothetical protein